WSRRTGSPSRGGDPPDRSSPRESASRHENDQSPTTTPSQTSMDQEGPLPPCTTTEAHPGSPAQDPALENSRPHFPVSMSCSPLPFRAGQAHLAPAPASSNNPRA